MTEKRAREELLVNVLNLITSLEELKEMIKDDNNDLVDIGFKIDRIERETSGLSFTLENCEDY